MRMLLLRHGQAHGPSLVTRVGDMVSPLLRGQTLKAVALRGSIWTALGYALQMVLRLGSALVLTRLLMPEAYGLMNLVAVVLVGLEMLSDLGIAPSIVRDERGDDRRFLDTHWTVQVIRGALLWMMGVAAAAWLWWVAADPAWSLPGTWGDPALPALIAVASSAAFIISLTSTKLHQLRRHLRIGRIVAIDTVATLASIIVMIALAWQWRSVWALVAGALTAPVVKVALSWLYLAGPNNCIDWDADAFWRLYHFAKWVFFSSALFFLASQGDRLLLGYFLDKAMLGVYGVAALLAAAGMALIDQVVRGVMFPAYGRVWRERPDDLRRVFYQSRRFADAALVMPSMMMVGCGAMVVLVLFDARYAAAGWMFEALALRAAMSVIAINGECVLVAKDGPQYIFYMHTARATWIIAGMAAGWALAGLEGVVWAVALSEMAALAVMYVGLMRHRLLRVTAELPTLALAAAGLLIGWALEAALWSPITALFAD